MEVISRTGIDSFHQVWLCQEVENEKFSKFIIEAEDLNPEKTKPIQSSLPGFKGRKSIEKKYKIENKPDVPAKYSQVDPDTRTRWS